MYVFTLAATITWHKQRFQCDIPLMILQKIQAASRAVGADIVVAFECFDVVWSHKRCLGSLTILSEPFFLDASQLAHITTHDDTIPTLGRAQEDQSGKHNSLSSLMYGALYMNRSRRVITDRRLCFIASSFVLLHLHMVTCILPLRLRS